MGELGRRFGREPGNFICSTKIGLTGILKREVNKEHVMPWISSLEQGMISKFIAISTSVLLKLVLPLFRTTQTPYLQKMSKVVGCAFARARGGTEANGLICRARNKESCMSPLGQEAMCSRLWVKKKNVNIAHYLNTPRHYPENNSKRPWLQFQSF